MTLVSQAFVQVRPDLSDFNAALRAQLKTALNVNVADRTLLVRVALEGGKTGVLNSLQAQMPKTPLSVLVKPVFAEGSIAALQKQLGVVPIEVVLAGGQAEKISKQAAAAAAAGAGSQGPIAQRTAETITTETVTTGRAPSSVAEAEALAKAERNVAAAELKAAEAARGLEKVRKQETVDAEALTVALKKLSLAEAEVDVAQTKRIGVQQGGASVVAPKAPKAAVDEAANVAKAAADKEVASKERVAKVEAAVTSAKEVATKAEITNANAIDITTQANRAASLATSEYTRALTANDEKASARLLELSAEAQRTQELIVAKRGLTEVSGLAANVPNAGRAGGTDLARAQLELKAAKDADAAATDTLAAAEASLNKETIFAATESANRTRQLVIQKEETVALLRAEEARGPVVAKLASIDALVRRAQDPSLSLASRATAATNANIAATKAVQTFAAAESGATAQDKARIASLEGTTLALKEQTVAQNQASIAAQKASASLQASAASSSQFRAQAERGAAATGATFLGLRGAVLSASTGFLLATVAVTGLSKIVATAEQLQQSLNIFRSVAKATASQMIEVDAEARKLGADLTLPATSALDAANAMTELAKAGLSVNESMAAAKGVLQLAAAANLDVGDSANITATELNAFGLAGDQATRVANLLAGASVAAQGDISDFALAFQQTSAVAHQVGLSLEQTTAVLTQFAKAGLHGSDAGTSLRTLLLRLVPTTKAATDAQAELGIHINRNIPIGEQFTALVDQYTKSLEKLSPIAQQEILTKIFGQDAIRGAAITFTQGSALLNDIQKAVSAPGQVQELAAARTEGLGGAVEGLKSEVSTLSATIGSQFLPLLTATATSIGAVAQNANAAVTEFNKLAKITIRPVGNIFGGIDTAVQVGLAAAVGLGARSLLQGRAQKVVNDQLSKAVFEVNEALKKQSITQDEVNALWKIMGINAEEAEIIQVRAIQQQEKSLDELAAKQAQFSIISKEAPVLLAGGRSPALQAAIDDANKAKAMLAETGAAADEVSAAIGGIAPAVKVAAAAVDEAGVAMQGALAKALPPIQGLGVGLGQDARLAKGLDGIALKAVKTADVEVGAADNVTKALQRIAVEQKVIISQNELMAASAVAGATATVAADSLVAASKSRLAALQAKLGRIPGSSAGLGAGIGLSLLGGAIGGDAGGVLSSAGEGAVLGSFLPFPVAGPLLGAAAFGGITLLNQGIKANHEREAAIHSKWVSMTFAQQQQFLLENFPNQAPKGAAASLLADTIAKEVAANATPDFTPGRTPTRQQFTLPGTQLGLVQAGNIDLLNRPPVRVSGDKFGTVFSITTEFDGKQVVIPLIYDGKLHTQDQAITRFLAQKRAEDSGGPPAQILGVFGASPGRSAQQNADAFSNRLHLQQASLSSSVLDPGILGRTAPTPGTPSGELDARVKQLTSLRNAEQKLAVTAGISAEAAKAAREKVADLNIQIQATNKEMNNLAVQGVGGFRTAADFVNKQGNFNLPTGFFNIFKQDSASSLTEAARVSQGIGQNAKALANNTKVMTEAFFAAGTTLRAHGLNPDSTIQGLRKFTTIQTLTTEQVDALDVAVAKNSGSTAELKTALEKQHRDQEAALVVLNRRLTKALTGGINLSAKEFQDLYTAIFALTGAVGQSKDAIDALNKESATFTIPADITIAGINAENTKSLVDNLAAKRALLAAITKAVQDAPRKTKEEKTALDQLRIQQAQANADVISTSNQIAQQNVSNAQTLLANAAEAAGNLGAAEDKYIAFLKAQVTKADNTTAETLAAKKALTDEITKRATALKAVVQARNDLANTRLANQLARAQATPGIKDDKVAFQAQINLNKSIIAQLDAERRHIDRTSAAYLANKNAVEQLRGANFGLLQSIKALSGANSGFSLQDFFKAGQDQFNQFASNVSTSVTTSGGLRAALAGASLSLSPKLTEADREKLMATSTTNGYLKDILGVLKDNQVAPEKKPSTVSDSTWNSRSPWVGTDAATAQRIGRHVKTK